MPNIDKIFKRSPKDDDNDKNKKSVMTTAHCIQLPRWDANVHSMSVEVRHFSIKVLKHSTIKLYSSSIK